MSKPLDPEHPGRFSSSLCAGLAMLTCFSAERPVRGIADMAEELDLGRSTTHRYATTLVTLGYLEQGPSRKYRLSSRVSDFGLSLLDSMVVRRVAREHLKELRARTGRTASLGVLGGTEVAYIDRWQGSRQGQYEVDAGIGLGTRLPVHCSAAGKALLARLPEAEQRDLIAKLRLTKRGPNAITTKSALRAELELIAAEGGVAVEDEELIAGRRAVAAVVVDGEGAEVAAVELAVPADAYTREELLSKLGPKVTATAERIATALS
jgi:IclR family transcriptional regulator, pca regulon regulatory protein